MSWLTFLLLAILAWLELPSVRLLLWYKVLMFLVIACCDRILSVNGDYNAPGRSRQQERDERIRTVLIWLAGAFIVYKSRRMKYGP